MTNFKAIKTFQLDENVNHAHKFKFSRSGGVLAICQTKQVITFDLMSFEVIAQFDLKSKTKHIKAVSDDGLQIIITETDNINKQVWYHFEDADITSSGQRFHNPFHLRFADQHYTFSYINININKHEKKAPLFKKFPCLTGTSYRQLRMVENKACLTVCYSYHTRKTIVSIHNKYDINVTQYQVSIPKKKIFITQNIPDQLPLTSPQFCHRLDDNNHLLEFDTSQVQCFDYWWLDISQSRFHHLCSGTLVQKTLAQACPILEFMTLSGRVCFDKISLKKTDLCLYTKELDDAGLHLYNCAHMSLICLGIDQFALLKRDKIQVFPTHFKRQRDMKMAFLTGLLYPYKLREPSHTNQFAKIKPDIQTSFASHYHHDIIQASKTKVKQCQQQFEQKIREMIDLRWDHITKRNLFRGLTLLTKQKLMDQLGVEPFELLLDGEYYPRNDFTFQVALILATYPNCTTHTLKHFVDCYQFFELNPARGTHILMEATVHNNVHLAQSIVRYCESHTRDTLYNRCSAYQNMTPREWLLIHGPSMSTPLQNWNQVYLELFSCENLLSDSFNVGLV